MFLNEHLVWFVCNHIGPSGSLHVHVITDEPAGSSHEKITSEHCPPSSTGNANMSAHS